MSPDTPPPVPKPYAFADLPTMARIERPQPRGHDRWHEGTRSGRITLTLEALTPVHVASGLLRPTENPRQPLVKALVTVGGCPVIPGSSIKGCVRSVVEAITASCVRVTRSRDLPNPLQGCRNKGQLCLACQLFGAPDFQGLIRFSDLRLKSASARAVEIQQVPPLHRPRPEQKEQYHHNGQLRGRKFYRHGNAQAVGQVPIQVCRVGCRFNGEIEFNNITDAQLGVLLVALGQSRENPLYLKLGGAKPACYGSVQVYIDQVNLFKPQTRYATWDIPEGEEVDERIFIPKAGSLVLSHQLDQLRRILGWPGEEPCPSGEY